MINEPIPLGIYRHYKGNQYEVVGIAKHSETLDKMNAVNSNKQYYKANLGEKDMRFIIDAANMILEGER